MKRSSNSCVCGEETETESGRSLETEFPMEQMSSECQSLVSWGPRFCHCTLRAKTKPPVVLRHTNLHSQASTRWDFEWQLRRCSGLPGWGGGYRGSSPCPSVPDRPPDVVGSRLTESRPLNTRKGGRNKVEINVWFFQGSLKSHNFM